MKNNRSIQRCLSILRAFGVQPRPTLAELARHVELPHPTVLRFLLTLEEEGYVARDANQWRLTPRMFELGFAALASLGITEAVQEVLDELSQQYDGTSNLGEADPQGVIIIGRSMAPAERRRLVVMNLRVGSTLPSSSALAQALGQPAHGWSRLDYPESRQISVAVPVPGTGSRTLSLGISTGVGTFDESALESEVVPRLHAAAAQVGRLLRLAPV